MPGFSGQVDYWIQASTTAIWSDAGEMRCTETTPLPIGLPQMTGVADPWERAFAGAAAERWTILRTSIVLDPAAPALLRLAGLTRMGPGGRIGRGDQWFSWIHVDDWLRLVRAALGLDPEVTLPNGILVAAADFPVRNRDLMTVLRRRLRRPHRRRRFRSYAWARSSSAPTPRSAGPDGTPRRKCCRTPVFVSTIRPWTRHSRTCSHADRRYPSHRRARYHRIRASVDESDCGAGSSGAVSSGSSSRACCLPSSTPH